MYGKENNMTISNLREPKKKSTFHEEVNHHEYEQNRRSEKIEHFCQPS